MNIDTEVMVSAHLMSIQIDDGSPGDAFHSLKQKLKDDWKKIFAFSLKMTSTVQILLKGSKVKLRLNYI